MWWLVSPLDFLFPFFALELAMSQLSIFFLLLVTSFWEQIFCSIGAPDELTLFMAGFTFSTFVCKWNIKIHSAQNSECHFLALGLNNYAPLLINMDHIVRR